jgi:hypothetical protein
MRADLLGTLYDACRRGVIRDELSRRYGANHGAVTVDAERTRPVGWDG